MPRDACHGPMDVSVAGQITSRALDNGSGATGEELVQGPRLCS
jgi:hypothetical protein